MRALSVSLKVRQRAEPLKNIIRQKWRTNNLNACLWHRFNLAHRRNLCPKLNLAHRRKVKGRSRCRHPLPEFKGGGIQPISFGFLKKEKRIYSKNPEKGVIHKKKGKP